MVIKRPGSSATSMLNSRPHGHVVDVLQHGMFTTDLDFKIDSALNRSSENFLEAKA